MKRNLLLSIVLTGVLLSQLLIMSCDKEDNDSGGKDNESQQSIHDTITDVDNNQYPTIKIGDQVWMDENLKVTQYNDSTPIEHIGTSASDWENTTSGAYCWYENDQSNKELYGALYNWYAVKTGKLCPQGWHVPTKEEWQTLLDFVSSEGYQGNEAEVLKAESLWIDGGKGSDEFLFGALPGGTRSRYGNFSSSDWSGHWWTSTEYDSGLAWQYDMSSYEPEVMKSYFHKTVGFSVRCVKD